MTSSTPEMSSPLAATSVATSTLNLLALKPASVTCGRSLQLENPTWHAIASQSTK